MIFRIFAPKLRHYVQYMEALMRKNMKRLMTLFTLLVSVCTVLGQDLSTLKQDGLDEYGVGYLCSSQGVRFFIMEPDGYWDFASEIRGDDGTVIKLPTLTKIKVLDDRLLEVKFSGRRVEIPMDSIRSINNYYRTWNRGMAVDSYQYDFRHDAPTDDENSIDTDILMFTDFPTDNSVANRHIRFWMSAQLYNNIRMLVESLHYVDEEGEPFGCYLPNNDNSAKGMIDYYGDLFRGMYKKYIHHTVATEGGGLSLEQKFELQSVLPHAITYLHTDAMVSIGAAHGGHNCCYVSFDRKTGKLITPEDLFSPERTHQLKSRLAEELYHQLGYDNDDIRSFMIEELFLNCEDDTPLEAAVDSLPINHVALLDEGVIFTYLPYEIASFGTGPLWIFLPYSEAEQFMKPYHSGKPLPGGSGKITNDMIIDLNHQCRQLANERKWSKAVSIKQQAASYIAQLEGVENPAYDFVQWQLLELYIEAGMTAEAEHLAEEMNKRLTQVGDMSLWEMPYQENQLRGKQIQIYANQGNYEKVLELLEEYNGSPFWETTWLKSFYNYRAGHIEEAVRLSKLNGRSMLEDVSKRMSILIGEDRDREWSKVSQWFNDFLPMLAYQARDDSLLTYAYDAMILGKGILLNTENSFRQHIMQSGDDECKELFSRMQHAKEKLQVMQMLDSENGEDEYLEGQIKVLEEQLINKSKRFGDFTLQMRIKSAHVQRYLMEGEAAIEFAQISQGDSISYLAFILYHNEPFPKVVYVCSENELKECNQNSVPDLNLLYEYVWKRIERETSLPSVIYFSPCGLLHNMGIEYACQPDGNLFSSTHSVFRLSSSREIVLSRDPSFSDRRGDNSVALFGGINYDAAEDTQMKTAENNKQNNQSVHRDIQRGAMALDISSFTYLPETLEEVEKIAQTFQESSQAQFHLFKGNQGTETAFKNLSVQNTQIIHIATHGFYFSESDLDEETSLGRFFSSFRQNARTIEEKALACSGLLFAGASHVLNDEGSRENKDDGVLTASEVSVLDFTAVDMVILSACQTACGDLSSEGVFGLQRGFKKAGVKSLLMSLWRVDDHATQVLMVEFYKNLLQGVSRNKALQNAVNYLRAVEQGKYDSPIYWAAFILLDGIN